MIIDIWSDLHQEFWPGSLSKMIRSRPGVTLLCAGDIGEQVSARTPDTFKMLCDNYERVVYVPGNHDYYHSGWMMTDARLRDIENKFSNFNLLTTGKILQLGKYKLIGDAGWIPMHPFLMKYPINDLYVIQSCLPEAVTRHALWRIWADKNVDENTIVMTHHLPSQKCVAKIYEYEPTNKWFVGDCEDIIINNRPVLWIFGHTHMPFDFNIGSTRLICNPLGYPSEGNPKGPVEIIL